MSVITVLLTILPFVFLTAWYVVDNSQKQQMLDQIASSIGPYRLNIDNVSEETKSNESFIDSCTIIHDILEKQEMLDKNSAVNDFKDIHDMFVNVFIFVSLFVIAIAVFCPSLVSIYVKITILFLYLIMCAANFVYGYSRIDSKFCWLGFGLLCFAFLLFI